LQFYDTCFIFVAERFHEAEAAFHTLMKGRVAMSLTAVILAAAAATQPVPAPAASAGMADVAYTELAAGDAEAAVRKLEEAASSDSDPAMLINLGTAYARQGATDKAIAAFRAAAASPERYDLELADGSWMDSREAARVALSNLQRATAQASR
jgi:Tfp pilus assembly protein PilF